jgi:hypothetical protein
MPYLIALIVGAVLLAGGAWRLNSTAHAKGYKERDLACTTEKAELESARMEAERQAHAEREKGRINADRAAERVAELRKTMELNSERFNLELTKRASASRQCFSAPVARLLNNPSQVPASSGNPAGAAAPGTAPGSASPAADAPGSDEAGTSERAAASYIDLIRARFESCRAQLRAVIVGSGNDPID